MLATCRAMDVIAASRRVFPRRGATWRTSNEPPPLKLATLGLDLFGYRREGGAESRAEKLIEVIQSLSPVPA